MRDGKPQVERMTDYDRQLVEQARQLPWFCFDEHSEILDLCESKEAVQIVSEEYMEKYTIAHTYDNLPFI